MVVENREERGKREEKQRARAAWKTIFCGSHGGTVLTPA